jgi:N-acyl-D-amino-acid deacylase
VTRAAALAFAIAATALPSDAETLYDVVIAGGTVYDGTGSPGRRADVGIKGDRIAAVGSIPAGSGRRVVDANGLAVAPGFINMLSWANESLLVDGSSQSDIRQGVTLEVMGEGTSMGPLNDAMKERMRRSQGDYRYDVAWTTLAEYLQHLERKGVSTNVASFIGAATVRTHVLGLEDVQPTAAQMTEMRALVRREMEGGAMGIGSALVYAPGSYAKTGELVEMCREAARHDGMYISHIRDEGKGLVEAIDELVRISREAGLPAEIYHFKSAGSVSRMDQAITRVDKARAEGLPISANMYLYAASSNALWSRIPQWAHSGGPEALYKRLADRATRTRIAAEMRAEGKPPRTVLLHLRTAKLRHNIGRTLEEVARERGRDEVDTTIDLVLEDRSRIQVASFSMKESDIPKALRRPWMALGSDGASMAAEGVFLRGSTHPRAYGNFARLLGKYVREDKILTLEDAVHRISGLPAGRLSSWTGDR